MAAAVRRGGGGGCCWCTSSWAALTLAISGATVSTSTCWLPASGPRGWGGVVLPLDVNDVNPPLPMPPHMDAHGKPCHGHPLRPPLLPPRDHIQPKDPSRGQCPLLPNPCHPHLHPPVPAHKLVGYYAHQFLPLGNVGTPDDHNGAGEGDAEGALHRPGLQGNVPHGREMPLPPFGPRGHLLRPSRRRLPRGEGDPVQGGVEVGGAQVVAGRHGDDHLPHGMPRIGAGLAVTPGRASRAPRALTALTAGLARGLSTTGASGRLALLLALLHTSGQGFNRRRPWCRMSGDHAWNGTYRQREVSKAPMENGGAKMEQCNNKTNKLDEIHRNSYEIRTNFTMPQYLHTFIHAKFT